MRVIYVLYSLFTYCLLPILLLRLLYKSRQHPAYQQHWHERLGAAPISSQQATVLWIHAVSVGETQAAVPLIQAIQKAHPALHILLTNTTPTGRAHAKRCLADSVTYCYAPFECPVTVRRFLTRVKPNLCIIMETELWPNLIRYTAAAHIPILLANARLSEKSARAYRWIGWTVRSMLRQITTIAAQTNADAMRFQTLGAKDEQVIITQSIKYEIMPPTDQLNLANTLRPLLLQARPTWIAASTHPGEEEKILTAHRMLKTIFPNAALILVPRHPERFSSVSTLCKTQGFTVTHRSSLNFSSQSLQPIHSDVLLGDSMGELFLYYAMCDIAFVAGSFAPIGGHNILEPAALGLPIISGPNIHNFASIIGHFEKNNALVLVPDELTLAETLIHLFEHPGKQKKIGRAAHELFTSQSGALAKHVDWVTGRLKTQK